MDVRGSVSKVTTRWGRSVLYCVKLRLYLFFNINLPLHAYTFPINVKLVFAFSENFITMEKKPELAPLTSHLHCFKISSPAKILSSAQQVKIWRGQIRSKIRRLSPQRWYFSSFWLSFEFFAHRRGCMFPIHALAHGLRLKVMYLFFITSKSYLETTSS